MLCKVHLHSSTETAKKCYTKNIQRRLDRRLGREQTMATGYWQVKCNPPEIVKLGNLEVLYFYKAIPKTNDNTT
jgi:hypothetical protein